MINEVCRHPDGCETGRPVLAGGFCSTHYNRAKRNGGDPGPAGFAKSPNGTNVDQICSEDECEQPARTKGLCSLHYQRFLTRGTTNLKLRYDVCQLEGCGRQHYGNGWCQMHYNRVLRTGEPGGPEMWRLPREGQCSVEDCNKVVVARGFCESHYRRMLDHGSLEDARRRPIDPEVTMKDCRICEQTQTYEDFYCNQTSPDGRENICKKCVRIRDFIRRNNIDMAIEEIREFVRINEIDGCELCGRSDDLVLDHCHNTNRLRGLLCRSCNFGVGHFRDDPALLRRAADWLEGLSMGVDVTAIPLLN